MATRKQIEANRRNARKSTGPKTPEGKANVRLNALQHGLTARTTVLPFEEAAQFAQLSTDLEAEWQPQTSTERYHLEVMAVSRWKHARAEAILHKICHSLELAPAELQMADQLQKQQARLERAHDKAQHELQALQKMRHARPNPVEAAVDAAVDGFLKHEAESEAGIARLLRERTLFLRQSPKPAEKSPKQTQFAAAPNGVPPGPNQPKTGPAVSEPSLKPVR